MGVEACPKCGHVTSVYADAGNRKHYAGCPLRPATGEEPAAPAQTFTPFLDDFRKTYEEDDNEWWRIQCGDHQNLFEEACDKIDALQAELQRVNSRCPDCGVSADNYHRHGCDVARCATTGHQRLMNCQCEGIKVSDRHGGTECVGDVWSGEWPGKEACRKLGLWCYFDVENGWVDCEPDHPHAREDLNKLSQVATWNRATLEWE